jgi:hypothetical protein
MKSYATMRRSVQLVEAAVIGMIVVALSIVVLQLTPPAARDASTDRAHIARITAVHRARAADGARLQAQAEVLTGSHAPAFLYGWERPAAGDVKPTTHPGKPLPWL